MTNDQIIKKLAVMEAQIEALRYSAFEIRTGLQVTPPTKKAAKMAEMLAQSRARRIKTQTRKTA